MSETAERDPRTARAIPVEVRDLDVDTAERRAWPAQVVRATLYPDIVAPQTGRQTILSVIGEPTNGTGWFLTSPTAESHGIPLEFVGLRVWWVHTEDVQGLIDDHTVEEIGDLLAPGAEAEVARSTVVALHEELASARAEVEELRESKYQALREAHENARQRRQQHEADIARIGEALMSEADEREWCDTYDEFVEDLNKSLTVALPLREVEFEVTMDVTVRITKTVTAATEDAAYTEASTTIDGDDLRYGDVEDTEHVETERA